MSGEGLEPGASGDPVELEGTVALAPVLAGSRSEREAVVLRADDGRVHRLHLEGDQPFEQPGLRALLGRRVRVRGRWRNRVLRVSPADLQALP